MAIPVSQGVPSPAYPLVTVSWFSTSMTLLLFCEEVHCTFFFFFFIFHKQAISYVICLSASDLFQSV